MGSRFLLEELKGEMLGQPFESLLLMGYDNLQGQYCSVFLDTWGTGMSFAAGTANEDGEIQMMGRISDALSPDGRPYRRVIKGRSNEEFVVELWDTLLQDEEWMVMELTYTR